MLVIFTTGDGDYHHDKTKHRWTQEDVGSVTKLKSSVERGIRKSIKEQYPMLGETLEEDILPKKSTLLLIKW